MKPWKDLSMKERGAFIRVGVKNGITSVDDIRDAYNKFACGGHKFDDGGPKLTPEEQYQEMVDAKMMSAPLLRFGDERGSWRWSRNLGAKAYMPEIEVVAENKSGKSTTKREEQPTAIKNKRLTEEEKKEEEEFWTGQRNSEPEMAVTRRPEGYWREQGLKAPILSTGRPADEPIDWQGTGYNHSPEYQRAMSQYRIANMTPEQRWAMTDDQMFKGEVLNAGMGIMMAPAFNPIASIGSGIMDLKYNKNKDWTNYVGDALAIGLPVAGTALNAPTYYRNVQNLYNQGRRVYDMYKYLESLPTSYTGVPQENVAQFEDVAAGKIPRTFNVWTTNNKLFGKHVYAKRNGRINGKLYNVRDLNRNRYMLDTPRAKDYGEGVNAVSWDTLPYDIQTTPNGLRLVDLPNSEIRIRQAPPHTVRGRLTGETRTYAESKYVNSTDLILNKASRIPNNQGVIFNDIADGAITSIVKLPFEKYRRYIDWDVPILKEHVYNPKAQLLLTPDEPTWMSAWRYRNNQGLRNRMLIEKGYKPDKIFSPQELRKGIMNASYARGGRLAHKFDGTSESTQWLDLFKRPFRNIKYTISNSFNPDVIKARREYNKLAKKAREEGERTYKEAMAIQEQDRKEVEEKREAAHKYIESHTPVSMTRKWLEDEQKKRKLSDIEKKYIQASDEQSKEAYYIYPDGPSFRLQNDAVARVYPSMIDSIGSHFANTGINEIVAAGLPFRESTWANPAYWWKEGTQDINDGEKLINPFYMINYEDPYMRAVRYAKENHNSEKDPRSYEQMLIDGFNYANSQAQQEYGGEGDDHNILSQAARFYMNGTYNATPGYKDKVRTEGRMLLNTNPDFRVLMDANYGIFPYMEGTKKTINK